MMCGGRLLTFNIESNFSALFTYKYLSNIVFVQIYAAPFGSLAMISGLFLECACTIELSMS